VKGISCDKWFSAKGTLYGGAYLVRVCFILQEGGYSYGVMDYAGEFCERLLRRIEIKHEETIRFQKESIPVGAALLPERIRFALVMMDAARVFNDMRFLNAALKVNDRCYRSVRRIRITPRRVLNDLRHLLVATHYITSIAAQESLKKEIT
jgi:hypothetical protein